MWWALQRFYRIILFPRREWGTASGEKGLLRPLLFLLGINILFRGLRILIGILFNVPILGNNSTTESILFIGVDSLIFILLAMANAGIVFLLAPVFLGQRYLPASIGLATYSMCPIILSTVLRFITILRPFTIALFLYSLILYWIGLPRMMHCALKKRAVYFIVSMVFTFIVYLIGYSGYALIQYFL
jgi:hypothetical protein